MVVLRAFRPLTAKLSPCGASRHFFGCGLPVLDCLGNGENAVRGNKDGAQWNRDDHFYLWVEFFEDAPPSPFGKGGVDVADGLSE